MLQPPTTEDLAGALPQILALVLTAEHRNDLSVWRRYDSLRRMLSHYDRELFYLPYFDITYRVLRRIRPTMMGTIHADDAVVHTGASMNYPTPDLCTALISDDERSKRKKVLDDVFSDIDEKIQTAIAQGETRNVTKAAGVPKYHWELRLLRLLLRRRCMRCW